jgi:hypothetical protein
MHLHMPDAHLLQERLEPQIDSLGHAYYAIDDMRFPADGVGVDSTFTGRMWPGGVVYYQFNATLNATRRQQFRDAAAAWAAVAPVTFVESTGNGNWIVVQHSSTGNSSWIGMKGGAQEMNIAAGTRNLLSCMELGTRWALSTNSAGGIETPTSGS